MLNLLLALAPIAVLILPLLAGRFVGEGRVLGRLHGAVRKRRVRLAGRRVRRAALRSLLDRAAIAARGPPSGRTITTS